MARVGDAVNAFVLVNTAAFLAAVVLHAFGRAAFFSPSFQRDGFCVSFQDKPWFNSHHGVDAGSGVDAGRGRVNAGPRQRELTPR